MPPGSLNSPCTSQMKGSYFLCYVRSNIFHQSSNEKCSMNGMYYCYYYNYYQSINANSSVLDNFCRTPLSDVNLLCWQRTDTRLLKAKTSPMQANDESFCSFKRGARVLWMKSDERLVKNIQRCFPTVLFRKDSQPRMDPRDGLRENVEEPTGHDCDSRFISWLPTLSWASAQFSN